MRTRSVGSPSSMSRQAPVGGTAKGTNSFESHKGIVTEPELAITASEAREWIRRNPHARAGVLEALAARGVLVIVPDGWVYHRCVIVAPREDVQREVV
jgi:hypothetical protein